MPAGVRQFLQHVAAEGGGVHDVIVRLAGRPHGESLVVARGEADVFRPRRLDGFDPFLRVEAGGIEARRQFGVFLVVQVLAVHHPFALRQHAVQPPMEEDAELVVLELFAGFQVLRRRHIFLGAQPCEGCQR